MLPAVAKLALGDRDVSRQWLVIFTADEPQCKLPRAVTSSTVKLFAAAATAPPGVMVHVVLAAAEAGAAARPVAATSAAPISATLAGRLRTDIKSSTG